jgi:hypothetical protein
MTNSHLQSIPEEERLQCCSDVVWRYSGYPTFLSSS